MTPPDPISTELIDGYLARQLDLATQQRLDERLQTDDLFRREVALQQALIEQLRLAGQQQLRARMQQWDTEVADRRPLVRPLWQRTAFYVAASVGLAVGVLGLWWLTHSPARQISQYPPSTLWLQLPLVQTGAGFVGDSVYTDSVWVELVADTKQASQYRFMDTLVVYMVSLPRTTAHIQLAPEPGSGRYLLRLDTVTYRLERGFRQLRPLEPRP